jgi:hypothetical protein
MNILGQEISIYDNGGKTADRYTVVYLENCLGKELYECRGMSEHPTHPQGYGQLGSATPGRHLGKFIEFDELPKECQMVVIHDLTGFDMLGVAHRPTLITALLAARARLIQLATTNSTIAEVRPTLRIIEDALSTAQSDGHTEVGLPRPKGETLDDDTAEALGAIIAHNLDLKHDHEYPDRWPTRWGTKTNKGLARTLRYILH